MNGWAEHVVCKSNICLRYRANILLSNFHRRSWELPKLTIFISPHLASLHWLPIDSRIQYTLAFHVLQVQLPQLYCSCLLDWTLSTWLNPVYLTEPLKVCEPTRQLRFSSDSFILCFPLPCACTHSLSQRSFSYIVPSVWNTNQGQKGSTYTDYKPRLKREHLHRLQTEAKKGAPTRNTNRG